MTRVLVADDHAIFREGLRQILEDVPDIDVVEEASNGQEVLDKIAKADYDLLLLDIAMPGISGLDLLKQLRSEGRKMRVLVLSMYPEEQYAVRAIRAGASGYLTKASASEELIDAIRKVTSGGRYISASILDRLLFELDTPKDEWLHDRLSDREFQIFRMIGRGSSVSEIAHELSLSVKTVSTHRGHILEKMKMKTNMELINYAIKNGIVSTTD
ncbi:MAG: response regulator transcription factor [Nitrospiraceae bacterium]|nr:response regulator transcription factor [Nitrospiraceae bacterium]